jgi:acyl-CoA synthetase (AMP-forming)/AMP-acid ligase II
VDESTLVAAFERRLREDPEGTALFLVKRDREVEQVSFRALMDRAMAFAAYFGRPQATRGIVGVCLYHSLDLYAAFVGGIWAGHIPTMLAPPSPRIEPEKYSSSFTRMLEHVQPDWLLVDPEALAKLHDQHVDIGHLRCVDPRSVRPAHCAPHPVSADEIALLQHSSGTTGLQKGIALSHGAILEHDRAYASRIQLSRDDVVVSWLPAYHDMGLIATFLLPLLNRIPLVQLSQFDWVLRPAMLMEQIERHRGTLCWLPNFAYLFLAESVRHDASRYQLGSVRMWINCSEPVSQRAHTAFLERFADSGVTRAALTASYAMAENVFAATQSGSGEYRTIRVNRKSFTEAHRVELSNDADAFEFVSNGTCLPTTELRVLDKANRPLGPCRVGQLALRGSHVFAGYFRRDDLTETAMHDGWYKTGDLGFVHDGHVYVTGRVKDLMIIQGRNFYPSDVERAVAGIPGINPGRIVAFGLPDERAGTEKLVILFEAQATSTPDPKLTLLARKAVAQELDCTPSDVRMVPARWLIKSTSGKLARDDNRKKYLRELLGHGAVHSVLRPSPQPGQSRSPQPGPKRLPVRANGTRA